MPSSRLLSTLAILTGSASLALAGCSSGSASSPSGSSEVTASVSAFPDGSTMAKIQDRGKVVVGTAFDIPLFAVKNPTTGKVQGFDADIARLLAAKLTGSSENVEFVETTADNREPFASSGKVDMVIETYSITPERQEVISFAGPYYVAGQDLLVPQDSTGIESVADLNGKKVCAVSGTVTKDNVLAKAPDADITEFADGKQCVEGVKDGRFDSYVDDDVTLIGEVELAPDQLRLVGAPFTKEPYGIGIKKDDAAFQDFLNKELTEAIDDGSWRKVYDANIGSVTNADPQIPTPGDIPKS